MIYHSPTQSGYCKRSGGLPARKFSGSIKAIPLLKPDADGAWNPYALGCSWLPRPFGVAMTPMKVAQIPKAGADFDDRRV